MPNFWGLGFLFQAKDQATPGLRKVEDSLSSLTYAATRAAVAFKGLSIGRSMFQGGVDFLGGLFDITDDARKFELTMNQLQVVSGANVGTMKQLRDASMEAGMTGLHGPQQMAEAMYVLATAGYRAADAMTTAKDALRLMTASGGEIKNVKEAANIISMVQTTWGTTSKEAIDKVAQVANMTKTSFGEMQTMVSHVMRGVGMGASVDQTFAMAGMVRNLTGNMESAATMVGVIQERMQKMGSMKDIAGLGVQIKEKDGKFRGPLDILWDLYSNDKFNKLEDKATMLFKAFGSRQGAAIHALFTQLEHGITTEDGMELKGRAVFDHFIDGIKNASQGRGAAQAFEDAVKGSFDGVMQMLDARLQTMKILVGEGFLHAFKPAFVAVVNAGEAVASVLDAIPISGRTMMAQAVIVGGILFTLTAGLGTLIFTFMTFGSLIGGVVAAMFWPFTIAAAAVGVLAGALALVGAGLYAAFKNNIAGIATGVGDFIGKAKLGVQVMKQLFAEGRTSGDVHTQIMSSENAGLRDFLLGVWETMNRIKNFAYGMWDGFVEGLKAVKEPLYGLLGSLDSLMEAFNITLGSASDNEAGFKDWGAAGKSLGLLLADLANAGIAALAIAIEMFVEAVKAAKSVMKDFGFGGKRGIQNVGIAAQQGSAFLSGKWLRLLELGDDKRVNSFLDWWDEYNVNGDKTDAEYVSTAKHWSHGNNDLFAKMLAHGPGAVEDPNMSAVHPGVASARPAVNSAAASAASGTANVTFAPINNISLTLGDDKIFEAVAGSTAAAQNRAYNVPFEFSMSGGGRF